MTSQLLLTDQRTPEQKAAYALLEKYHAAFPAMREAWERLQQGEQTKAQQMGQFAHLVASLFHESDRHLLMSGETFEYFKGGVLTDVIDPAKVTIWHDRGREYIIPHGDPRSIVPDIERWGEADSDPLADLQHYSYRIRTNTVRVEEIIDLESIDFSRPEERLLDKREIHNQQLILYALGAMYEPKPRFVAATKRPPSYHDHDPTKSHKKRRRK